MSLHEASNERIDHIPHGGKVLGQLKYFEVPRSWFLIRGYHRIVYLIHHDYAFVPL